MHTNHFPPRTSVTSHSRTYACSRTHAHAVRYTGHSAHVTNVKFSFDDRQIVSAGGKDNCVFVWHTEYDGDDDVSE